MSVRVTTYRGPFVQRGFGLAWEPWEHYLYRVGWVVTLRVWRTVIRVTTKLGAEDAWKQSLAHERGNVRPE